MRLGVETELGPYGSHISKSPRAALFVSLVAYAHHHGRLPSEVYAQYLEHQRDYELLFTFGTFKSEEEEKARKKAEEEAKRPKGFGRFLRR